jgi:hypothetical protein
MTVFCTVFHHDMMSEYAVIINLCRVLSSLRLFLFGQVRSGPVNLILSGIW